jgi:hypothetical protein
VKVSFVRTLIVTAVVLSFAFGPTVAIELPAGEKPSSAPLLKISFIISEPCSLIAFMDILSHRHNTTSWVKNWYVKKRAPSGANDDQAMINLYQNVMDGDTNHAEFVDEIGRKLDLDQKVLCLASDCQTLPQLLTKIQLVVDDQQYQDIKKVLEYFAPVYQELLWQPRLATLEKQLEEHRKQAIRCKMSEHLVAVQSFMKAPWVSGLPLTVVLVPLPFSDIKHTHGESMGLVQIVELRPTGHFEKSADVVFHEACHALWFSKKDMAAADKQFATASGETLPLTELYEGMATALAQGCFALDAFGKTSNKWYGDTTINLYAHKVFPLYAEYLKAARPIDSEFGRRATEIFFKQFPDADRDIRLTSEYLVLAEQIPDLTKFKAEIYKALPRTRGCSICTPIDAAESIKTFENFQRPNVCVLASSGSLEKLASLGVTTAQIEQLRSASMPATLEINKKRILFCLADAPAKQQKLLFACLKKNKWPLPLK